MDAVSDKKQRVLERLRGLDGLIVAVSGGVDSAVLLALAVEALGPARVVAATGVSAAVPAADVRDARAVASALGVRHEAVPTAEIARPGYRANTGDRCFHCRTELFERLRDLGRRLGIGAVAYGAIVDDLGEHRPGMAAARDAGALAPLLDAGLAKAEVRRLAAEAGLAVRDKPAAPCLASRIPVGTEVRPEVLARVGRAEAALRRLGLGPLRVRHHGEVGRLELGEAGWRALEDPERRAEAARALRSAGYRWAAIDLDGYRPGSVAAPSGPGGEVEGAGPIRPKPEGGQ